MKKRTVLIIMTIVMGIMLSACSSNNGNNASTNKPGNTASQEKPVQSKLTTKEMVDEMLKQVEQPMLMELTADMVKNLYHLDPAVVEQYTIMTPLMNVKTNEIAIFKVKDAKDIAAVETAVKKRATDVQKSFETYLPDQYENAKNYKLVTKGNYVLFIISDKAADLENIFNSFFDKA
ncbi:hypothetical protein Back11_43090 [Paenibacillus baekrokdamisoli]|uniref:Uncharacterized protein n=1 Tax=Paenibacillus baekrokdamisoli TaxID=1712516 RepID=A0A3G9JJ12_9BACL|nr:DUF4358 domain-containing protein [Paenibacillus baekrokdamisoli]MBB3067988.1 PBP1b-binding outer membrane lipoprotein LpoB [Paenibacillus baekrokdamisoli]BBH22964.1 hypothetical protein Back11_43090 [Paenibacillus baekrokdamisoli]